MKTIIYLLLLLLYVCRVSAQPTSFSKYFWQQDRSVSGTQIKPFNDGYLLAQGVKFSEKSRINICLSRLTQQADTLWNRIMEDTIYDYTVQKIYITTDHYLLITGTRDEPTVVGNERAFVLKTDTLGNKIWLKEYGYDGSWVVGNGNDIIEIPGNEYLLAGFQVSASGADLGGKVIYKLDTAGNIIWTRYDGKTGDHGKGILYNPADSGFYVTGINYNYNAAERNRAGLFRYDKDGAIIWAKYYSSEIGKRIVFADSSIVMLTNRKLIKTNLDGDSIWVRDFSFSLSKIIYYASSSLEDMTTTADGGYVLGGYSLEGYYNYPIPDQSTNYKIIKTDNNGIGQWNKSFSVGIRNEYLLSIIETKDTGFILCGISKDHYSAKGDTWLVKTDQEGNQNACTQMLDKHTISNMYCPPQASAFKFYYSAPYDSSKYYSFTWKLNDTLLPGANKFYTELLKAGTYRAYAKDSITGCEDSSGLMIVAFDPPPLGFTAGPDLFRCILPGSAPINLTSQGKPANRPGTWTGPVTSPNDTFINPNTLGAGTYQYVFSMMLNNSNCIFKDTIIMVLDTTKPIKPLISSNKAQPMCNGDTVTLSIPFDYTSITWSTRNIQAKKDSIVATFKDSMLVFVYATTPGLVCRDSSNFKISFNPKEPVPLIMHTGPLEFCEGDSALISSVGNYDFYMWATGDSTKEVYAKNTAFYQLKAKHNNTCLSDWSDYLFSIANERPATPSIIQTSATTLKSSEEAYTYNWYVNDSILPDHTREITALMDGSYRLITKTFGTECESVPSDNYLFLTTANDEKKLESFDVYPNPAGKYITIQNVYEAPSGVAIRIFSMIGEQVLLQNLTGHQKWEIDITHLKKGNYILVIEGREVFYRKVFVKE